MYILLKFDLIEKVAVFLGTPASFSRTIPRFALFITVDMTTIR